MQFLLLCGKVKVCVKGVLISQTPVCRRPTYVMHSLVAPGKPLSKEDFWETFMERSDLRSFESNNGSNAYYTCEVVGLLARSEFSTNERNRAATSPSTLRACPPGREVGLHSAS